MAITPELIALVGALWSVITALAGLVYRELRQQIADKDTRIATLEAEAYKAIDAKNKELDEWKRLALERRP